MVEQTHPVLAAARRVTEQERSIGDHLESVAINAILEAMEVKGRRRFSSTDTRVKNILHKTLVGLPDSDLGDAKAHVVSPFEVPASDMVKRMEDVVDKLDEPVGEGREIAA